MNLKAFLPAPLSIVILVFATISAHAQNASTWNGKSCAVVLTYDDAIDVDLDNVVPALDSLHLKGTFYLIGSSPVIYKRLNEWRHAAAEGHELGNHAMFHPCDGSLPGRGFVTPDNDLSKYTISRAEKEIRANNTLLKAIDGKELRTFAYPCGDLRIGDSLFYNGLRKDFAGARGVGSGMQTAAQVNLDNIDCYAINGQSADYMIDLVKKAMQTHTLLVFLFHGVGGGHNINVSLDAHSRLLHFLKQHEADIWIAPMVDVADYIRNQHNSSGGGKPLYNAPLGVEGYTYRKSFPIDVAKTLDTIKMAGFTELEGGGGRIPAVEFRKLCDERGISIPSIGAGYDQLVKSPDSVIDKAKTLGATYVMCAWIPHTDGVLTPENAKKAAEDFNRIGKILKEHGLIFCYHAHGYEFQPYEGGTLLDYLFQHTDPKYVSFEMDIMWIWFGGGDPLALLKKYGSRWKLMHLKDLRKGAPKNLTGLTGPENDVPLGTGELDIPAILKEAKKAGIKHYFIEDESNHVNEQVPQSIAYLKGLRE